MNVRDADRNRQQEGISLKQSRNCYVENTFEIASLRSQ
jgi:hypothetical protein